MDLENVMEKNVIIGLLKGWRVFVCILILNLLIGGLTVALLTPQYYVSATVIGTRYSSDVTPASQSTRTSFTSLLGNGVNDLPDVTDFRLYNQFLTSPDLGNAILNSPVIHQFFKAEWQNGHWAPPDTITQSLRGALFEIMGRPAWTPPDGFSVADFLRKHLQIVPGKDSKLVTLGIWTSDPKLGVALISLVSTQADSMVRRMAQKRLHDKVVYLNKEISRTSVQEVRQVLAATLARAQVDSLYSQTDLPFAAEFLETPKSPLQPEFPNVSMVFGAAMGASIVLYFLEMFLWVKMKRAPVHGLASWLAVHFRWPKASTDVKAMPHFD